MRNHQAEVLLDEARQAFEKRDFELAVRLLTRAMRLDPDDPRLYVARAETWIESGAPQYAVPDASRALRLDRRNLDALVVRGEALVATGQGADAAEDFTRACELAPESTRLDLLFARGRALTLAGRWDAAIDDFTAVIKADPDSAIAYNERGFACANAGRPAKALRDLNHAIRLEPDNAGFYLNRGSALCNMNRKEEAAADWEKAYELGRREKTIVEQLKHRFALLGRGLPRTKPRRASGAPGDAGPRKKAPRGRATQPGEGEADVTPSPAKPVRRRRGGTA